MIRAQPQRKECIKQPSVTHGRRPHTNLQERERPTADLPSQRAAEAAAIWQPALLPLRFLTPPSPVTMAGPRRSGRSGLAGDLLAEQTGRAASLNFQRAARGPLESQPLAFVQQDTITGQTRAADGHLCTSISENHSFSLFLKVEGFGEP